MDPNSGFCSQTKIYYSLCPKAPAPPLSSALSLTHYALCLLSATSSPAAPVLVDAVTGNRISSSELMSRVGNLAVFLQSKVGLSKGDCVFVLSQSVVHLPILYFALCSFGAIVSPSNPASTTLEISHQLRLSKPVIAFATSDVAHKIPSLRYRLILLDSNEFFDSMVNDPAETGKPLPPPASVSQSDVATIMYSSGTTGKTKGVLLTHRNFIFALAGAYAVRPSRSSQPVKLCVAPYFHMYGMLYCLMGVAFGECLVSIGRFNLRLMMKTIEEFRVTHLTLVPPVLLAIVNDRDILKRHDLSSLEVVISGGAPLSSSSIDRFKKMFPCVQLAQGYGLTETTSGIARAFGPIDSRMAGAAGRLMPNCEAKIIDPKTGIGLPPMKQGELCVRGPYVMKGYVDDKEATDAILDSEGWLKTGDLCYFNNGGFLFFVERIKELIKYKGYQVPPAELEHILQSHPDIVDAAVIPYPDEEAGTHGFCGEAT